MRPTTILRWLLCLAIGLPMLVLVVQFAGVLLSVMGDEPGGRVLRAIAIGVGVAWVVTLLGMIIVAAIELAASDDPPRDPTDNSG